MKILNENIKGQLGGLDHSFGCFALGMLKSTGMPWKARDP